MQLQAALLQRQCSRCVGVRIAPVPAHAGVWDALRGCSSAARGTPSPPPTALLRGAGTAATSPCTPQLVRLAPLPSASTADGRRSRLLPASATVGAAATATASEPAPAASSSSSGDSAADSGATGATDASIKSYTLVNFYHLVSLRQPFAMLRRHREWIEGRDVRGRIYISRQGINAQYSGETEDALAYVRWVSSLPEFEGLHWISDPVPEHCFPRLRLKHRPNLVQLAGGMERLPVTDVQARATPLAPSDWKAMLRDAGKPAAAGGVVVLDVRNGYEWDAGHFEGAQRPQEDQFSETPTDATVEAEVPAHLRGADPNTPIMMYCTGGIRCDVYSTYLRSKGFNNLYTLEGGVHNYLRQQGGEAWRGSLFVFDERLAVAPPGESDDAPALVAATPCLLCGGQAVLPHMNCANLDCNDLFLACEECKDTFRGCCCAACTDAPRMLRPSKSSGQYGAWTEYAGGARGDAALNAAIAAGRGEGRISRRRKRAQALREKQLALRAVRVERRRLAKEAIAAQEQAAGAASNVEVKQQQQDAAQGAGEHGSERLERLRVLREKLVGVRVHARSQLAEARR